VDPSRPVFVNAVEVKQCGTGSCFFFKDANWIVDKLLSGLANPAALWFTIAIGLALLVLPKTRSYAIAWAPIFLFLLLSVALLHSQAPLSYLEDRVGSELGRRKLEVYFPMLIFVSLAQLVILIACVSYTFDIGQLPKKTLRCKNLTNVAQGLCWLCVALASCFLAHLYLSAKEPTDYGWDALAELNEFLSMLIFILFIVIDWLVFSAARSVVEPTEEVKPIVLLALEALLIVDLPCLVGVSFVIAIHHLLHHWMPLNELFTHGLSVGAVAFHIAITQTVFSIIKTRAINGYWSTLSGGKSYVEA
jgi:hypothetical protein